MRHLFLSLLVLLVAGCCTSGAGREVMKEAAGCPWQLSASGTCFPISCQETPEGDYRVIFLTAGHVTDLTEAPFLLEGPGGRLLAGAELLSHHEAQDAALVEVRALEPVQVVPVSYRPLLWGDRVIVPGFQGGDHFLVEGLASRPDLISAPMFGGGSGSPVLDEEGRARALVVAIRVVISPAGSALIYHHCKVLPLYLLADWLEEVRSDSG